MERVLDLDKVSVKYIKVNKKHIMFSFLINMDF